MSFDIDVCRRIGELDIRMAFKAGPGLTALFGVMALALVVFGITVTGAVRSGAWRRATPPAGRSA